MNTLPGMLDSILKGQVLPCEIILVNDGSTDDSLKVAKGYADKYSFVKVFSQDHLGVSAARNLGISMSTGYWISFLDADDYIEPDMYAKMLEALEDVTESSTEDNNSDIDGCICGYFTHKDNIITPYFYEDSTTLTSKSMLKAMFTEDAVRGFLFSRLFRADLIKNLAFDPEISICEDLLFQTKLFSSSDVRLLTIPIPMYHYIQHQQSATVTKEYFVNDTFIYKPAYDKISSYVKAPFIPDSYNTILDHCMDSLLKQYRISKSSDIRSQIRQLQKEMRNTKTPLAQKSKRRIAYEIAPVILSRIT